MKKCISVSLIAALALTLAILPTAASKEVYTESGLENQNIPVAAAPESGTDTYVEGQFSDVSSSEWYAEYVRCAYNHGLMDGTSKNMFSPDGTLTAAEAVAIASRLHNTYHENETKFQPSTPWYQPYVEYAVQNDILVNGHDYDFEAPIARVDFALMICNALPKAALTQINEIWANDIPDLSTGVPYEDAVAALRSAGVLTSDNAMQVLFLSAYFGDEFSLTLDESKYETKCYYAVYDLYRAGIMTGNDAYGTFAPYTNITRSSVAAVVSRVVEPSLRQHTTLKPKPASLVPVDRLANLSSLRRFTSASELKQSYDVAREIVEPLANLNREAQLCGIALMTRIITENEVTYSMSAKHYNDPYGFFVLHTASCAGSARATGLCLNMLGIPYEHVHEGEMNSHQWARVNVDGTYWICDAFGLYCGPEPAPYEHPNG